jgi:hypothetical protein
MTDQQWKTLVAVVRGEAIRPLPTAFIIDSPWLPNWAGHSILDYFTDERIFLEGGFNNEVQRQLRWQVDGMG